MNLADIPAQGLHNQFLLKPLSKPQDVVRNLGCVQSQDFPGAKWAVGMRSKNTVDADIQKLL